MRATDWPDHQPLLDRLESGLGDRMQHLATEDPDETAERRQERIEHEQIQRDVIDAQRTAVIELRDGARSTTRPCARSSASSTSKSCGWRADSVDL